MHKAWFLWLIISLFFGYQYVIRVMPSVLFDDIAMKFNMDNALMGQFSGLYYIGYSLMHLPIGLMLDRFGPKKIVAFCAILIAVGLLPLILSTSWEFALLGRFLIGIGSSGAILGVFKVIRILFPANKFTTMLSYSVVIGLIGAMYAGGPLVILNNKYGFDAIVYGLTICALLLCALMLLTMPNSNDVTKSSIILDLKHVLLNKKLITICILSGLMVGPIEGFADTWGTLFLEQVHLLNKQDACYYVSIIFLGMCVGSPFLGWLNEKTGISVPFIIMCSIMMFLSFLLLMTLYPLNNMVIIANMLIIGTFSAYQLLAIYKVSTMVDERFVGIATATANMIIMIFGYAFHTLIGIISHYSNDNVYFGVSIIPIALIISSIGFLLISDKK